jgi:hypothetical protein
MLASKVSGTSPLALYRPLHLDHCAYSSALPLLPNVQKRNSENPLHVDFETEPSAGTGDEDNRVICITLTPANRRLLLLRDSLRYEISTRCSYLKWELTVDKDVLSYYGIGQEVRVCILLHTVIYCNS